ncbi:MAG: NAD(P)-dependent oxidoreductase [Chthoniobacterales bacterium]
MLPSLNHLTPTGAKHETLAVCFADLKLPLTARQAQIESDRCLYCYDAPCTRSCPSEIDVAGFIRNIAHGNINGAAQVILEQNILGGSCARVCPTEVLCERACVLNQGADAQPIKIGLLQRYAIDHMKVDQHPFQPAAPTGRTIAIVGAGPAGLACAHRLALLGNTVEIFESRPKPGGLNEYGVAAYKMVDDYAQKEIEFLLEIGGITIHYNQTLGKNVCLQELQKKYDALFLALGLGASRALDLKNEEAPGLSSAIDYIATLRQAEDLSLLPVPKRALIIGAGNTAIDMAIQIALLGAEEVTVVYRRGLKSIAATNYEQDLAKTHQVRFRTWLQPHIVLLDNAGNVCGMRFKKTKLESGGALGTTGELIELPADAIFKAVGQMLDASTTNDPLMATLQKERGKITIDKHYRTNLLGVYAGGDCVLPGEDLTVQAVQHGKRAAEVIHLDLNKKT